MWGPSRSSAIIILAAYEVSTLDADVIRYWRNHLQKVSLWFLLRYVIGLSIDKVDIYKSYICAISPIRTYSIQMIDCMYVCTYIYIYIYSTCIYAHHLLTCVHLRDDDQHINASLDPASNWGSPLWSSILRSDWEFDSMLIIKSNKKRSKRSPFMPRNSPSFPKNSPLFPQFLHWKRPITSNAWRVMCKNDGEKIRAQMSALDSQRRPSVLLSLECVSFFTKGFHIRMYPKACEEGKKRRRKSDEYPIQAWIFSSPSPAPKKHFPIDF